MNTSRDPDTTLAAWLDDGPDRLSSTRTRAIKVAARTTPQARPGPLGWLARRPTMTRFAPLAGAIATIAIAVGVLAIFVGMPSRDVVGAPTPGPSATGIPTASPGASSLAVAQPTVGPLPSPLDTFAWRPYTSGRYGFHVGYPPGWTATPSAHQWDPAEAAMWPNPGWDHFLNQDGSFGIGIFSLPVAPGTTAESWLAANCYSVPCAGAQQRAVNVTMDGHPAIVVPFMDDFAVLSVVDTRLYSIVAGQPIGTDNSLQIVESFLSTLHLPSPNDFTIDTAGWTPYTSATYGYTTSHPADWTVTPATRAWSFAKDNAGTLVDSAGEDHFTSPDGSVRVSEWTIPTTQQVTDRIQSWSDLATWAVGFCGQIGGSDCNSIPQQATKLCNERRDCHPAFIVKRGTDVDAFWFGGNYSMEAMVLWRSDTDPAVASYGGGQRLLEGFLSTADVVPPPLPGELPFDTYSPTPVP